MNRNRQAGKRAGNLVGLAAVLVISFTTTALAQTNASVSSEMPKSHNPFGAYLSSRVPEAQLANSPLLTQLIRDGKLYLSLKDAIRLALENNLDLEIARYNLPIANTDIRVPEARRAVLVVRAPERPGWCSRLWAPAPRLLPMTQRLPA
jgi:hypothetical protein